jgi:ABC-type sugar transport system substrate-binding protein
MKNLFKMLVVFVIVGMLLSACASPAAAPTTAPAAAATSAPAAEATSAPAVEAKKLVVGISPPADSEFYQLIKKGIEQCSDGKAEILWQTPASHQAVEDQQKILEAWVNQKVDAIGVTTVGDVGAMDDLFKRGTEAGIEMYFMNMAEFQLEPVNKEHFVSSVGYNNYGAAKILGEWVLKTLGNEGKVAVLLGTPGVHANDRLKGFEDALAGSGWEIVVTQQADWARDKGQSVAETILQANPDITLIYGQNDEMALGAYQAVSDRGMADKVKVVGLDGVKAALESIKAGELTGTMNVVPKQMGCQLITDIIAVAEGGSVPQIDDIDVHVTDASNVDEDMKAFE